MCLSSDKLWPFWSIRVPCPTVGMRCEMWLQNNSISVGDLVVWSCMYACLCAEWVHAYMCTWHVCMQTRVHARLCMCTCHVSIYVHCAHVSLVMYCVHRVICHLLCPLLYIMLIIATYVYALEYVVFCSMFYFVVCRTPSQCFAEKIFPIALKLWQGSSQGFPEAARPLHGKPTWSQRLQASGFYHFNCSSQFCLPYCKVELNWTWYLHSVLVWQRRNALNLLFSYV